ncbi:uncharacterized protein LOC8080606 [Sorghum bicolor]|uniref:uncharacterized protein LOC8080606 n=1 Tax=Sorghum bicolor TaxID=4558 RepID=UPI000B424EAA|nr:uncharacterized protein LOC8080606 [Sorghum bicolor]|eukprot:XP_021321579.1 uncharacterized protein LOC8080606 [Sorghum bicolor]
MIPSGSSLQIDACIVSWLYSTVSKEIWNDVYRPNNTALAAWTAITGQFLDNSLQQAVYLQQEFHSLFQGDLSVGEYCGRLKRLADSLYDCGAAVSDQALVINTLRGLNNKFSQAIAVLSTMTPPPSFLYTKSYLLQEETRIKHSHQMEAQTALLAAGSAAGQPVSSNAGTKSTPAPPTLPPAPAVQSGSGGDRRKKRKADNRNRQGASSTPAASAAPPPPQWTSPYNPWQGVVQAWPLNSWRPGVLAPRPIAAPPSAMAALAAQQDPGTIPPGLYTALNGMSLNTPSGGGSSDWFLDTGATSHMASHPGSTNQDGYPPM